MTPTFKVVYVVGAAKLTSIGRFNDIQTALVHYSRRGRVVEIKEMYVKLDREAA